MLPKGVYELELKSPLTHFKNYHCLFHPVKFLNKASLTAIFPSVRKVVVTYNDKRNFLF